MNCSNIRNFILAFLLSIPFLLSAHNPLSATYYAEVTENIGILNIYLAQGGVDQVMYSIHGKDKIRRMSKSEYKQAIVTYIKSNFTLTADEKILDLKEGGIKLGDHQTDLKFVFEPFDKNYSSVSVSIPAFKENYNHQTVFSYNFYDNKNKLILSKKNDYKGEINRMQYAASTKKNKQSTFSYWIIGGFVFGTLLFVLLGFRKHKTNKYSNSLNIYL